MRFLIFILISLILSIPLGLNGSFADTAMYYDYYNTVYNSGIFDGIEKIYQISGKYEIGLIILFFIEKYLFLIKLNEFYFLIINITIVNCFIYWSYASLTTEYNRQNIIFISIILVLSYLVLSNTLYAWRNIISLCFIIRASNDSVNNTKKFILLMFAFLFHYSAIVFALLLFVFKKAKYYKRITNYAILFLISSILYFLIIKSSIIFYFTSGGEAGQSIYSDISSIEMIINRIAITLFCIILTLIIHIDYKDRKFIILCQFSFVLAILFYDKWFLSWRISLPAMIILILLTLKSTITSSKNRTTIIVLLLISLIPAIRILILLSTKTGGFH